MCVFNCVPVCLQVTAGADDSHGELCVCGLSCNANVASRSVMELHVDVVV